MLRNLENQANRLAGLGVDVRRFQGVQDRRQFTVELHVDDGADDLRQAAFGVGLGGCGHGWVSSSNMRQRAEAPEMISISSLVICA
jgi:hypothetical protein